MSNKAKNPLSTTQKSLEMIEVLRELQSATVTELAEEMGLTKSTVHHHLSTLAEFGYVVNDNGTYHLGLRFLEVGGHLRHRSHMYRNARVELDKAAAKSGELGLLMVEEAGRGVFLYHTSGHGETYIDTYAGSHSPIHSTGLGKAILAHLPPEKVERILEDPPLESVTEKTITSRSELSADLKTIRDRGYAIEDGEFIRGIRGVAVPILSDSGAVLGAAGLSGPVCNVTEDDLCNQFNNYLTEVSNVTEVKTNVWGYDVSTN